MVSNTSHLVNIYVLIKSQNEKKQAFLILKQGTDVTICDFDEEVGVTVNQGFINIFFFLREKKKKTTLMNPCCKHSKTSFEKNCFSAWASTLNMGLINKVDMVCLSPVGYGV